MLAQGHENHDFRNTNYLYLSCFIEGNKENMCFCKRKKFDPFSAANTKMRAPIAMSKIHEFSHVC